MALNELRTSISEANATLEGDRATKSFAAVTFEELLTKQMEGLTVSDENFRPSAKDRVSKLGESLLAAVEKLKLVPDELFEPPDPSKDVNTPEEEGESG